MSQEIRNVILIGAGGNLGPLILAALLLSPFNISILSRATSKSTFPASVHVFRTDYTEASLLCAFAGQDAIRLRYRKRRLPRAEEGD